MKASPIDGPQYRPTQPPSDSEAGCSNPAAAAPRASARENQFPGLPSLPEQVKRSPRQPSAMAGDQTGGASVRLLRSTTAPPPCNVFMLSVQALNWLLSSSNGHNGRDARALAVAVLDAMTRGLLLPMHHPHQPAAILYEARGLIDEVQGALRMRLAKTQEGLNLLDVAFRPAGQTRPSMHVFMPWSQPATPMTGLPAGLALRTAVFSQAGSVQSPHTQTPDTSSTVSRPASEFEERNLITAVSRLRNQRDFTGAPLPSGASIASQSLESDSTSLYSSSADYDGTGAQAASDAGTSLAGSSQGGAVRTARPGARSAPYPMPSSRSSSSMRTSQAGAADMRGPVAPQPPRASFQPAPPAVPTQIRSEPDPASSSLASAPSTAPPDTGFVVNGPNDTMRMTYETKPKNKTYTITRDQYNTIVRLAQQNANPSTPRRQRLTRVQIGKKAGRGVSDSCVGLVLARAKIPFLGRHALTTAERLDIGRRFAENQTLTGDNFLLQENISKSTLRSVRAFYQAHLKQMSESERKDD